jgi:hypothetical protein
MITITSSILFLAFYTLYYTSKRVPLTYNFGFEKWMRKNPTPTKITGITLLVLAYILWLYIASVGSGTLLFIIELMTIGSLIVILKPLKIIAPKSIILLLFVIGFVEMYYS